MSPIGRAGAWAWTLGTLTAALIATGCGTVAAAGSDQDAAALPPDAVSATSTTTARGDPSTGDGSSESDGVPDPAILAAIHVGNGPTDLAAFRDQLAVRLEREGRYQLIDQATSSTTGYLGAPASATGVVVDGNLWVPDVHTDTVSRFDGVLSKPGLAITVQGAGGLTADGSGIWVLGEREPSATHIAGDDGRLTRTISLPGLPIHGPWWVDGSLWIDATGPDGEALFRIDPGDGTVRSTIPYAPISDLAAIDGVIWMTSPDLGYVIRLQAGTDRFLGATKLGRPRGLAADRDGVWVVDDATGSIDMLDATTGAVTHRVALGYPNLCCLVDAFGSLWVSSTDGNVVLQLDPDELRTR